MKIKPLMLLIIFFFLSAYNAISYADQAQAAGTECTNGVCEINYSQPMQQTNISPPPQQTAITQSPAPKIDYVNSSDSIAAKYLSNQNWLLFGISTWFVGLLLAFTPCVLPLIILIAGLLTQSGEISHRRCIGLALVYVMSLSLTFTVLGILASSFGIYLSTYFQNPWILAIFSGILALLAFSLLGFYKIRLPRAIQHMTARHNKLQSNYNFIEVAIMGVIATLIASPCIAAPLVGILSYISNNGSLVVGAIGFFLFGLGMGTPLIVATSLNKEVLPQNGPWQHVIKFCFGLALIGVAILIISRIIPGLWSMLLWSVLIVFTATYMIAIQKSYIVNCYAITWKTFSVIVLTYGLIIFTGFMLGNKNPSDPLQLKQMFYVAEVAVYPVTGMRSLDDALVNAKAARKPVMIFFEANGCAECVNIKSYLESNDVKKILSKYVILDVDLTTPGSPAQEIAATYKVVGTPEIIFFDASGKLVSIRILGHISMDDFISTLNKVLNINNKHADDHLRLSFFLNESMNAICKRE